MTPTEFEHWIFTGMLLVKVAIYLFREIKEALKK